MIITLIGMPACGKSCMARAISKRLGMKYIDSDRVIEKNTGKKLQQIIEEDGLDGFKELEEKTLLSLDIDNVILSTGGSAVYYPSVMERYKKLGYIVYLFCSYEIIEKRLGDFSKRGVVLKPDQTLRELYDERCALYKKYADVIVDCSGTEYPKYQYRVISAIKSIMNQ